MKELLKNYFGQRIRHCFLNVDDNIIDSALEIRIRIKRPVIIRCRHDEQIMTDSLGSAVIAEKDDIRQMVELMSDYSVYSFEEEIRSGYITLCGGFRVGLTGRCICESGEIRTLKNITGINIRISREIIGCSDAVMERILSPSVKNTLVISPPNCGKTTLLRDIIRNASNRGYNIGLADERSEIAGTYMGELQNNVGMRTDVYDRCPKSKAVNMLLRSMGPDIIAVDEIGTAEDVQAIENISNSGIKLFATIHGYDIEQVKNKLELKRLLKSGFFECFIVLSGRSGPGRIEGIYDSDFKSMG